MLILKQLLTFCGCFIIMVPLFLFDIFMGVVIFGMNRENSINIMHVAITTLCLSTAFSGILAFSGVFPWTRTLGGPDRKVLRRIGIASVALLICISSYVYLSITILDAEPRKIQLIATGMTKGQVETLIGPPDWTESATGLWAYRVRGDGIGGILVPYYLEFDPQGHLLRVFT